MPEDLRNTITSHLSGLTGQPFPGAARQLLAALGYQSDRTLPTTTVDEFCRQYDRKERGKGILEHADAHRPDWKSAQLLFQLTDTELARQMPSGKKPWFEKKRHNSYLFFALELKGEDYARGELVGIARRINRLLPMPIMVLIKHRAPSGPVLSIAIINRRPSKVHPDRDVLEKATIIRDISLTQPHRGHLDILHSLAISNLERSQQVTIDSFEGLQETWEKVLNVELLSKRFYNELANWFFWAQGVCRFPVVGEATKTGHRDIGDPKAHQLIRLLTRLLFVWFIKQKDLVPADLFDATEIKEKYLRDFDAGSSDTRYYKAILQNLFFACLNQPRGERGFYEPGQPDGSTKQLRYADAFKESADQGFRKAIEATTPFLNGGLFECMDRPHPTERDANGQPVTIYHDGFSEQEDNPLSLPDYLFFGAGHSGVDLSEAYGDPKRGNESVRGLIPILKDYQFTIAENTPIEQEIALDPELLGQVFEGLLASCNPQTGESARKQTGSFYTPRPIVDYMVDESLKAHFKQALVAKGAMDEASSQAGLDILFAYREADHAFSPKEKDALIAIIDHCKILDPACGSGAFPMGILQKLVYVLGKLDPDNKMWKLRQIDRVDKGIEAVRENAAPDLREREIAALEAQKQAIEDAFARNELGYGRKLYLIENCLYGVDLQPIAIQVSKLRCFISLIVDQRVDRDRDNFGIHPLPNLEAKFVAADALISVNKSQLELIEGPETEFSKLRRKLERVRKDTFSALTQEKKERCRWEDQELRGKIITELKRADFPVAATDQLAGWDPADQNASASFFDPEWMFGVSSGFGIVIGNPPYIQLQRNGGQLGQLYQNAGYETFQQSGDIYQLFYERGCNLLRHGTGVMAYITSNSWLKAQYGRLLRQYFATHHTPLTFIEMGKDVFTTAIVDTAVLIVRGGKSNPVTCRAVDIEKTKDGQFPPAPEDWGTLLPENDQPWIALSSVERTIMEKMKSRGKRLGLWDISIYYGIKTGYDKAFIVDAETRDQLIAEHRTSEEILKPILRGRDMARYRANRADRWLIDTHNGFAGVSPVAIDAYPAIKAHLDRYIIRLRNRQDQGITPYNLRSCAYHGEFQKTKLFWMQMAPEGRFALAPPGVICNPKCFMITGQSLHYLCALLNSSLVTWFVKRIATTTGLGLLQWEKFTVERVPVIHPDASTMVSLRLLVKSLIKAVDSGDKQKAGRLHEEINCHVYKLYDLTSAEIDSVSQEASS